MFERDELSFGSALDDVGKGGPPCTPGERTKDIPNLFVSTRQCRESGGHIADARRPGRADEQMVSVRIT